MTDCIGGSRSQLSGKASCCHLYGSYPLLRKGEGGRGQEEREQEEKVSTVLFVFNMELE